MFESPDFVSVVVERIEGSEIIEERTVLAVVPGNWQNEESIVRKPLEET